VTGPDWLGIVRRAREAGAFGRLVERTTLEETFRGPMQITKSVLLPSYEGDWAEAYEAIAGPTPERCVLVEGYFRAKAIGRIVGIVAARTFLVELP